VTSIRFVLKILDSAGTLVRTLDETHILQVVNDFNLSSDILEADGRATLRIWADGLFDNLWDGTDENNKLVASGQYYIVTTSTDRINRTTTVTKAVTVQRALIQVVDGMRVSPNPARDTVQLWARSRIAGAEVNAHVYTVTGELVAKLTFGNSDVVTWDMTNRSGERLASGVYLIVILAKDPETGQTQRRIIKLAVLR
jgi:flagellar hook assembly protein FlgD